jgi:hypothetical protein
MLMALAVLAAVMLSSCHLLTNPADPRSVTYTGTPVGGDVNATPVLPAIARAEVVTYHAPGRELGLVVPAGSSPAFVEPRDRSGGFNIVITLEDAFTWDDVKGAIVWTATTDAGGVTTYYSELVTRLADSGFATIRDDLRQIRFENVEVRFPDQSWVWLRIIDRAGHVVGDRLIGFLAGDTDGNGQVSPGPDDDLITDNDGFVTTESNPDTIRADVNRDGVVTLSALPGALDDDNELVSSRVPNALPPVPPIPDFWD